MRAQAFVKLEPLLLEPPWRTRARVEREGFTFTESAIAHALRLSGPLARVC